MEVAKAASFLLVIIKIIGLKTIIYIVKAFLIV
jgi:hypothetical protein